MTSLKARLRRACVGWRLMAKSFAEDGVGGVVTDTADKEAVANGAGTTGGPPPPSGRASRCGMSRASHTACTWAARSASAGPNSA